MKMFWVVLIVTIIILVGLIILFFPASETAEVCFKNTCFKVKVANNYITQTAGLMFRKELKQNAGMLFVFPKEKVYPFWMKNTLIPLDIIWLDSNKKVVFISENNQPCKISKCSLIDPGVPAKYVLEVGGGTAKGINLAIGDKMEIKN